MRTALAIELDTLGWASLRPAYIDARYALASAITVAVTCGTVSDGLAPAPRLCASVVSSIRTPRSWNIRGVMGVFNAEIGPAVRSGRGLGICRESRAGNEADGILLVEPDHPGDDALTLKLDEQVNIGKIRSQLLVRASS